MRSLKIVLDSTVVIKCVFGMKSTAEM